MFFELRQYRMRAGQYETWVRYMDEVIIPFQQSKGMCIAGSFVDEENGRYVWIRRFADEAERERQYAAVYDNDFWRDEVAPRVGELIDRDGTEVSILRATPRSYLR